MRRKISNVTLNLFLTVALSQAATNLLAQPTPPLGPSESTAVLTTNWIRDQLAAGNPANLAHLPYSANRRVPAAFVAQLLTNEGIFEEPKVAKIVVANAIIVGALDLTGKTLLYPTHLVDCTFESVVDFSDTQIPHDITLARSSFSDDLALTGARLGAKVDFSEITVARDFNTTGAQFKKRATLTGMRVGGTFAATNTIFQEGVDLSKAKVGILVLSGGTTFHQDAIFSEANISDRLWITETKFLGSVFLDNSHIHLTNIDAAIFDGTISLEYAQLGILYVSNSTFNADVSSKRTNIEQVLDVENTTFAKLLNFSESTIHKDAFFVQTTFAGPVTFALTTVRNLKFLDSRFLRDKDIFFFTDMQVTGAVFASVETAGMLSFMGSRISSLTLTEIQGVVGDKPMVRGPLQFDLRRGTFERVLIEDIYGTRVSLNLNQATIHRNFSLNYATLDDFTARYVASEGVTEFDEVQVRGRLDLTNSAFTNVFACGLKLTGDLSVPHRFRVDGLRFDSITATSGDDCSDPWDGYRKAYKATEYSPAVYRFFENHYRDRGDVEAAAATVHLQKDHQWLEAGFWERAWLFLLRYSVGDGAKPQWAFYWSLGVLVVGYFVFRNRENMMLKDETQSSKAQRYNAWWYSLDLFLPVIDLQAMAVWTPKPQCRFRLSYMRLHSILGWVLLPIGIAALTGIIK